MSQKADNRSESALQVGSAKLSTNIEIGEPINKPSITTKLKPGGWYALQSNSPFILTSISECLTYLESDLKQKIPNKPEIVLNSAGSQVVASSVNIFLEFSIKTNDNESMYVRSIVNDKAISVKDHFEHDITVKKIYYTDKKLF